MTYTREEALSYVATTLALRSIAAARQILSASTLVACEANEAAADALGFGDLYREVVRELAHNVPEANRAGLGVTL